MALQLELAPAVTVDTLACGHVVATEREPEVQVGERRVWYLKAPGRVTGPKIA